MEFIFISLAIFFSLLLTRILIINKNNKNNKNKKHFPPSPPNSLPIVGHLHLLKKPLHQSLAYLSNRYGAIFLLSFGNRPVIVVSSAYLAEECFTTNDIALADRPQLPSTTTTSYNHTNLALAAYGPNWREMRRIIAIEALSGHRLSFFADVRTEETRELARLLFHESGRVELRSRLFGLAMNIMMRIIAGKRYYGVEGEHDKEVHKFREAMEKIISLSGVTNIGDFLPSAIGWIARRALGRKMVRYHKCRDGVIQTLIEEQRRKRRKEEVEEDKELKKEKKKIDKIMIDALLSLQEEQPEQYTDVFMKALIMSLVSGGTDTSSNTIEWSMSLLLNHPEKLEKARQEIDKQVGHDRLLDESDLTKLPYLYCIINETLRLYPVGPLLVPHVARVDCKVGGYDVDRGTILLVNVYKIHRDPILWPEATKFLPERFQNIKLEAGQLMPFGMGRRRCPGEGLALKEVGLVLGTLIQCFEWNRIGPEEVDMIEGSGLTMPRANRLEALCKPRPYMINVLSQI